MVQPELRRDGDLRPVDFVDATSNLFNRAAFSALFGHEASQCIGTLLEENMEEAVSPLLFVFDDIIHFVLNL